MSRTRWWMAGLLTLAVAGPAVWAAAPCDATPCQKAKAGSCHKADCPIKQVFAWWTCVGDCCKAQAAAKCGPGCGAPCATAPCGTCCTPCMPAPTGAGCVGGGVRLVCPNCVGFQMAVPGMALPGMPPKAGLPPCPPGMPLMALAPHLPPGAPVPPLPGAGWMVPPPAPPGYSITDLLAERVRQREVGELMKLYYLCCKYNLFGEAEKIAHKACDLDPENVATEAALHVAQVLGEKARARAARHVHHKKCHKTARLHPETCAPQEDEACKKEQVAALMKQYDELDKEGKYQEAEKCAAKAVELDPDNVAAAAAFKIAQMRQHLNDCESITVGKDGEQHNAETINDAQQTPEPCQSRCTPSCHSPEAAENTTTDGHMVCRIYPVADIDRTVIENAVLENAVAAQEMTPREGNCQALVDLITHSIAPQTWKDLGGTGEISYCPFMQCMVVYQTPAVQEQVLETLTALRHLQADMAKDKP